jgi:hypothetical protein
MEQQALKRIKSPNEVFTGAFLIAVAALAFYLARSLSRGTEVGVGPGFVPYLFAFLQLGLGSILVVHGMLREGPAPDAWHLRPLVLVLASVAFFAISIERLGLVIALAGLIFISCAAHRGTTLREALALAAGTVLVSSLLFVKALGLAISLWPKF